MSWRAGEHSVLWLHPAHDNTTMWTKAQQVGVTGRQISELTSDPKMHSQTGALAQTCIWSCHIFPAFCSGGPCLPSLSNSHMVNTGKFSWHLLSVCAFLEVCCFFFILSWRFSMPNTCCFYMHQLRKDNNSEHFFHHRCQPTHSCPLWEPPQCPFAV